MSVDKVPASNSIVFVCLNNYAGLFLKTPTKILLIDPVDVKAKNFPKVDALLVTHEHYDHLDQRLIVEIQQATNCTVIADSTSSQKLKTVLPPKKLLEAHVGDKIKIGEVTIKVKNCQHHAGTPVSYLIISEDHVKVWHTADSSPFPEMATIGKEEELNLVFCTVGIAPGTSAETGSQIAWLTKPRIAVPYHAGSIENQKKFAQILKKELPKTTCLIPEIGKAYLVVKGEKKLG
jgi:L-ascorbate metabolism protein UlaG (beta-lactamase superfamily)